jgi:hypothetical protein
MSKLLELFKEHPTSVGESYLQHMAASFSFGVPMLMASFAALIHGIFPFLFLKTGSTIIARLYDRMVVDRARTTTQ